MARAMLLLGGMKKLLFCSLAGCTGSGQVTYSGEVQTPSLVEVSPGVQVTADADVPVFYSDNYYWRQDNGVWLRSAATTRAKPSRGGSSAATRRCPDASSSCRCRTPARRRRR